MLLVTASAKERLKEKLHTEINDAETFVRIAPSPSRPAGIGFVLDKEKRGDKAIRDDEGRKLLLIGREVDSALADMVLDVGDGELQFTITRA